MTVFQDHMQPYLSIGVGSESNSNCPFNDIDPFIGIISLIESSNFRSKKSWHCNIGFKKNSLKF